MEQITHHIKLILEPIKQRPRRTSPWKQVEINRQVENLLDRGVIKESNSAWSSPVVWGAKKDGSQRFCVDYQMVNAITVPCAFPLPHIDDTLDELAGAKSIATLDIASRYWQVPMDSLSRDKAAFATASGLYEWTVMPMGLKSAPSTLKDSWSLC